MGNCLVTKLKGVVQNDRLPIMGNLFLDGSSLLENSYARITPHPGLTITIKDSDGNITTVNPGPDTDIPLVVGKTYNMGSIENFLTINLGEAMQKGLKMPSSLLSADTVQYLLLGGEIIAAYFPIIKYAVQMIQFDVAKIDNISLLWQKLQSFPLSLFYFTNCENIITTEELANLGNNQVRPYNYLVATTGHSPVTGTIENFVATRRNLGEESSSRQIDLLGTGTWSEVTFNGETISEQDSTLSWTATTITLNGVTINA